MTCVPYNIVKEGFLSNIPSQEVRLVSLDELNALYDGDPTTPAITVSGITATFGFLAEFGESYDVCYVDYHTDENVLNNISIKFGTTSGTENNTILSLNSPGVYRATVSGIARFISVRHIVTSPTNINQLEIFSRKNDTLGFGSSVEASEDNKFLSRATVGNLSSSSNKIRLFNDNDFDESTKIAIAPTRSGVDNYIYLATNEQGPFYNINEHGFKHPGSNPLNLVDDPMLSTAIHPQWEVITKAQGHLIQATPEGLTFDLSFADFGSQIPTFKTTGLISREFFTANSFTVEIDVRFTRIETLSSFGASERDFFFVLTNGFPISDYGYFQNYQDNQRRGISVAGVTFTHTNLSATVTEDTLKFGFRYIDGSNSDSPRLTTLTTVDVIWDAIEKEGTVTSVADAVSSYILTQAQMEDVVNEGNSFADFTEAANWHRFKLVYDHIKQELSGYVNNIKVGSRVMGVESFEDACRLFIGTQGSAGITWQLKNFKVYNNVVSNQQNLSLTSLGHTVTATISGIASNVNSMRDDSTATAYIGPSPTGTSKIRIDFTEPKDVTHYSLDQRLAGQGTTIFGTTYFPDVARTAIADFGGKHLVVHTLPGDGTVAHRAPTYSGIPVIASGINYVELQFTSYDRAAPGPGALAIERFNVYAEEKVNALPLISSVATEIPWIEGQWRNIKQYGNSGSLSLKDKISPVAGYWPYPETLVRGVNYDVSSAVSTLSLTPSTNEYDLAEVLFSAVRGTGEGGVEKWQSGTQTVDPIYVWRYFEESSRIVGIFFDADTQLPSTIPNVFKFQYLVDGGNPTVESDWFDIPPVSIPHPYTITPGDRIYQQYKDFLINNNDGEFYINHYDLPAISDSFFTGFSLATPDGTTSRITNAPIDNVYFSAGGIKSSKNVSLPIDRLSGLSGYIELDAPVWTRGIRMVVIPPTRDSGRQLGNANTGLEGTPRFEFGLVDLSPIRDNATGSFTSPVFDTGTRQNTERVKSFVKNYKNTSSSTFVRSFDLAPVYKSTSEYESWRRVGFLGNRLIPFPSTVSVFNYNRAIEVSGVVYFVLNGGFLSYDPSTDTWSQLENYPSSTSLPESFEDDGIGSLVSPGMFPDNNVRENVAVLDNIIYVAAFDDGDIRVPRLMKYDTTNPTLGWVSLPTNRPDFTEDSAVMAGFNGRLYFFNGDGITSYYDIATNTWVLLDVLVPTFGGTRNNMTGVQYNNLVYLFGGTGPGSNTTAIFNTVTSQFTSGTNLPLPALFHQAILVEEEKVVYLFPLGGGSVNERHGIFKYYLETDETEIVTSLMWCREITSSFGIGRFHYRQGDYIYRYDHTTTLAARARINRDAWEHGKLPDLKDPVWGSLRTFTDLGWSEVGETSEIIPQKRYVQVKVELRSFDKEQSPVLEGVNIVTPHDIIVPASGTADVYVKVNIDSDPIFDVWYGGELNQGTTEQTSILYSTSDDGVSWGLPTVASGTFNILNGLIAVQAPWVVRTDDVYQIWFTRRTRQISTVTENIRYLSTNTPSTFAVAGGDITVISAGTTAENTRAVTQPSVIKESSTDYRIWYTGTASDANSTKRIFSATSSNGTVWSSHQRVIGIGEDTVHGYDNLHVFKPSVIKDGSVYKIWYAATDSSNKNRILYRESLDGITWGEIILTLDIGAEGTIDLDGVYNPYVIKDSNMYRIYYTGLLVTRRTIITATSVDGVNWTNFTVVLPSRGIRAPYDTNGPNDVSVIVTRGSLPTRQLISGAALKLHNGGAAL